MRTLLVFRVHQRYAEHSQISDDALVVDEGRPLRPQAVGGVSSGLQVMSPATVGAAGVAHCSGKNFVMYQSGDKPPVYDISF